MKSRFWAQVWNILSAYLVVALLGVAIILGILRIRGFGVFTVLSGSMEPKYHVGSLVYIKPVNIADLAAGDVISYTANSKTIVTHRIVEVIEKTDSTGEEAIYYRTKGDANAEADGTLVHEKNVLGQLVFSIPLVGYLSYYIQRPPWLYIAIVSGMCLIVSVFMPSVEDKKTRKEVHAID